MNPYTLCLWGLSGLTPETLAVYGYIDAGLYLALNGDLGGDVQRVKRKPGTGIRK